MAHDHLLGTLEELKAVLSGHFLLSSGLHSDTYIQCARLFEHPEAASSLCGVLAEKLRDLDVDVVIGPAFGGIVFAYELARQLDTRGVFMERVDGTFALRRGFDVAPGSRVLIAEDVVTTGKSVNELLGSLDALNVEVLGVAAIVQRAEENPFSVPLYPLFNITPKVYEADGCPLCASGSEPVKPGSRGVSQSAN
jgi:orotate phosphoribosyltransferase